MQKDKEISESISSGYKFSQTPEASTFEEKTHQSDGPIQLINPNKVDNGPAPMYPGFEWTTLDVSNTTLLNEVHDFLSNHFVKDDDAIFRVNYSLSSLDWVLKVPGWCRELNIGVRASGSQKLVALISAIPNEIRVHQNVIRCTEVNVLCVHKKLRHKRLTPVLIKELTRRSYKLGIFQGVHTGDAPCLTPVGIFKYYHRNLNWQKLYECGLTSLPSGSTPSRQIARYKLPRRPNIAGLRLIKRSDVGAVLDLLARYLNLMEMAPVFTLEKLEHLLLHAPAAEDERVIWPYVVEDKTGKITDFFSFSRLDTTLILQNAQHKKINAACLYYYAGESAWHPDKSQLKARLNALMKNALVVARDAGFDVFNALTILHNPLFLKDQKFEGDAQLHYHFFNYHTRAMATGVDENGNLSENHMGGFGMIM